MAISKDIMGFSVKASADLSADQHKFVDLDANGKARLATAAGQKVLGVLQNDPAAADRAALIGYGGVTKVIAGAAIAVNAYVSTDAAGKARATVAVASGTGHTKTDDAGVAQDPLIGAHVVGIALEAAAADGDVIKVLLTNPGAVPTTAI
jgi:hypothetical protein